MLRQTLMRLLRRVHGRRAAARSAWWQAAQLQYWEFRPGQDRESRARNRQGPSGRFLPCRSRQQQGNPLLYHLEIPPPAGFRWLPPVAVLRFLRRVVQASAGYPVDLGVCGEMGGRRLEALALLGLGYRRLSITPASVGPIQELVRKVDLAELGRQMTLWLAQPPPDLRAALTEWATARGIETD